MYDLGPQFYINLDKLKTNQSAVLQGQKFRISILTERLIRLEYSETGKFVDLASALVVNRNFPFPEFLVKEDGGNFYIETKYMTLKYAKESKFTEKSLSAVINFSRKEWF